MFAIVATLHRFAEALCFMAAIFLPTHNLAAFVAAAFTHFSVKSNTTLAHIDIEDEASVDSLLADTPELDSDSETSAIYNSDDSSDAWSVSSATSEESVDFSKSSPFFPESPICSEERNFWECDTQAESNIIFDPYSGYAPHVDVKSSVPVRVVEDLTIDQPSEIPAIVVDVDDLDELEDYNALHLTPLAREEAIRRSKAVRRDARRAARLQWKVKPVKAHQHPAPSSHHSRALAKALNRPSRLRVGWTMADFDAELAREEEEARLCAEEEEDVVAELGSWPSTTYLNSC